MNAYNRGDMNHPRGFWSLIVTQFQGAFSDNTLKMLVTFAGMSVAATEAEKQQVGPLVSTLLSLPFLLFSMAGGHLADRFSKRTVTVAVKLFEIAVMLFVLAGFLMGNLYMGMAGVFLMGVHSAFFGPSKYGLLPELLPESRLSWGNGILELGTFTAIIAGTWAGGILFTKFQGHPHVPIVFLLALALVGFLTSLGIARVPAADPARKFRANFLTDIVRQVREIRKDRVLWLAMLGNVYFNFIGAIVLLNLLLFGTMTLQVGEVSTVNMNVALCLGIGLGSFAAGHLSGGKIEYGLVPLGALGLTAFSAALWIPGLGYSGALANLALLGFFGGFFVVPVNAIMQHRPDKEHKGAVLATGNFLAFAGIFLAGGVVWLLTSQVGLNPREVFLACAAMTVGATIYILVLLPDAFLRLLLWFLTHSLYRIRVAGRENIPERGGALFVSNHVSFVDALLVVASTDRPLRCIMFKDIYDNPIVKPFAKIMRAIPISAQLRPREMIKSLRAASDAIRNGEVVVIFAEGQITRIGQLLPFRRGYERIMKGVEAPIIPICLDGVWGSIFSYEKGRFLWKRPRRIPYPVTVSFGKPMPPTSTPLEVRQAVQELEAEAWPERRDRMETLDRAFIRQARRHPRRFFMADARTDRLTFGAALIRAVFMARRLRSQWKDQDKVGLLLPPLVPAALVNYAALILGKTPVNLNYTASDEVLASCAAQCGLKTVVTSKAFLEKVKLKVPATPVFLEDLFDKPRLGEKLAALLIAKFAPASWLGPRKVALDDLATVIFSSGSTGDPKGVMLTHYNIASNVDQLGQTFAFKPDDRILGILPFFHSFGFTATLAAPAAIGIGVVFHPTPLDGRAIGDLVRRHRVTFLLATPTFLQLYTRTCPPEDFGSLQFVMAGAEKLPERTAAAFEERFGIRPLEGYGCTECSPVVAVNTRDFRAAGFRQVGAKRGTIGHPLPGVSVRIVDPDTMQPLPTGQAGLMLVKGPNVMAGYLGRPEKTAEVVRDGWYVTGDIAAMDEDGFLAITDRLSRFSKIGGEMVPHIKVEDRLQELAAKAERCFAVAGVPDEKKGERLVVLHTLPEAELAAVLERFAASDLPNLWKPRADQFFRIDAFPLLGTGKLDLRQVKETAAHKAAGTA